MKKRRISIFISEEADKKLITLAGKLQQDCEKVVSKQDVLEEIIGAYQYVVKHYTPIKSPISWIGGKFYQRNKIIELLPEHKVYAEPFGGAGHVLLAKEPSKIEIYNDINSNLKNFFMVARDNRDVLMEKLNSLPYSRSLYKEWISEPLPQCPVEKAVRWFYILCSSYASKYGSGWSYSTQRSHAKEIRSSTEKIAFLRERLRNTLIECVDFRDILQKYDSIDTVFYVDPPYDGQSSDESYYSRVHNYTKSFGEQDHRDLAGLLNNVKGKALVSYYPTDLIMKLYPKNKWRWLEYKHVLCSKKVDTTREYRNEVFIANY